MLPEKTTFIKALLGQHSSEVQISGTLKRGDLAWAYLDQKYSLLNEDETIMENILSSSKKDVVDIRNQLARFQFTSRKSSSEDSHLKWRRKTQSRIGENSFGRSCVRNF